MDKRLKVAIVGAAVATLIGTGTAFAVAGPGSAPQTASTPETPAVTSPVVDEAGEEIAPETVTPTTTPSTTQPAISSEEVKAKQEKLLSLGYWMSSTDGKVGQTTQQAVMAFQKVQGLKRSGTFDEATVAALDSAQRPQPASSAGNVIEIDKKRQVIFFVRDGKLLWTFNTSTGTEKSYVTGKNKGFAHTPTGTFAVNRVVNGVDPGPLGDLYRPRYFTNNGIAVHGSASIPAYPASHGCARVSNSAMDFIWANDLMPMKASVWVYENPSAQPFAGPNITPTPTTTTTAPAPTTTAAPVPTTEAPTTTIQAPSTTTSTSTTTTVPAQ